MRTYALGSIAAAADSFILGVAGSYGASFAIAFAIAGVVLLHCNLNRFKEAFLLLTLSAAVSMLRIYMYDHCAALGARQCPDFLKVLSRDSETARTEMLYELRCHANQGKERLITSD
jgi:hypothetical protein